MTTRRRRLPYGRALLVGLVTTAGLLATPTAARAAEDEPDHYDARVQGYSPTVEAKSSSTGGAWMILVAMGVACVGVMFMDAKRTHLD